MVRWLSRYRSKGPEEKNQVWSPKEQSRTLGLSTSGSCTSVTFCAILDALKTCWFTDLSRPEGPYIYRLVSYIHIHIRLHIYLRLLIRLHWYEPLCWGICSYTNCISNGPDEAHDAGSHTTFCVTWMLLWLVGWLLYLEGLRPVYV